MTDVDFLNDMLDNLETERINLITLLMNNQTISAQLKKKIEKLQTNTANHSDGCTCFGCEEK